MPPLYRDSRSRSPASREGACADASLRSEVNAQRATIGRIYSALDILKSEVSGQDFGLALENQAHSDCLKTIQSIVFVHGQGSRLGECQIVSPHAALDQILFQRSRLRECQILPPQAALGADDKMEPPPQIALMDSVDKRKMLASWIFGGQLEATG